MVLDIDNNFYLISLSILITCLLSLIPILVKSDFSFYKGYQNPAT